MSISSYRTYSYRSLPDTRDFYIYRIWETDQNTILKTTLYVGSSTRVKQRLSGHHTRKHWPESYSIDLATCCCYHEMCTEEQIQIYDTQPRLNQNGKNLPLGRYERLIKSRNYWAQRFPDYTVTRPMLNWLTVGSPEWNAFIRPDHDDNTLLV